MPKSDIVYRSVWLEPARRLPTMLLDPIHLHLTKMTESSGRIMYAVMATRTDPEAKAFNPILNSWQVSGGYDCLEQVWFNASLFARFIGHRMEQIKLPDNLTPEEIELVKTCRHLN